VRITTSTFYIELTYILISFKDKYWTAFTPSEINSRLSSLEVKRIGLFRLRRYKIRKDGSSFSIRIKHTYDEHEGPKAIVYGNFYKSKDATIVDIVVKPSIIASILFPLGTISIPILLLVFPELLITDEAILSDTFARVVRAGFILLVMIPINHLGILMPMHQIRHIIEKELKLQKSS